MADYVEFLPAGFDRADGGRTAPWGTLTPYSAVQFQPFPPPVAGGPTVLEEFPDSPEIERGEQATFKHKFNIDWYSGQFFLGAYARGVMTQDSFGYVYRVLSSTLEHKKGLMAVLTITLESISFDVPPDEFEVEEMEFNPALWLHPLFKDVKNYNMNPDTGETKNTEFFTGDQIIQNIQTAINSPQSLAQAEAAAGIDNSNNIGDSDVIHLAKLLLTKMRQGQDTFYLAGFKISWSQFFFQPPELFPGGQIQDPFGTDMTIPNGGLPVFFWSTTGDTGGDNIFTKLAADAEPNIYGDGISWLRLCDRVAYQRTWFKITRSWIGGPLGHWDKDIYGSTIPLFMP